MQTFIDRLPVAKEAGDHAMIGQLNIGDQPELSGEVIAASVMPLPYNV
jgi:hypothetical protein